MAEKRVSTKIAILPCGGLSARGRLSIQTAILLKREIPEVEIANIVPLLAGVEEEREKFNRADFIMAISGCRHHCAQKACLELKGREPDEHFELESFVPSEVIDYSDLSEAEKKRILPLIVSQTLGRLARLK